MIIPVINTYLNVNLDELVVDLNAEAEKCERRPRLLPSADRIALLVFAGRSLLIDDICELPGVLVELDLELPFLIEPELGCRIQDSSA